MNARSKLRKAMREARQTLSIKEQQYASELVLQRLSTYPKIQSAQTVALYLANDGELDLKYFIHWCWQQNKQLYLPVIHPFSKGNLLFIEYNENTPMKRNSYGIFEPKLDKTKVIPILQLEVLLTPLVAFDNLGNRLGMGGGFYDRTLSSWYNNLETATKLSPIGIAHNCQKVDSIQNESWDIPIPEIITPNQSFKF